MRGPYLLQKGSPYIDLVNTQLYSLHEQGLLSRWINEMVSNSSSCDSIRKVVSSHGSPTAILGLGEVWSFFLIIGCGLAISFTIFSFEVAVNMSGLLSRKIT